MTTGDGVTDTAIGTSCGAMSITPWFATTKPLRLHVPNDDEELGATPGLFDLNFLVARASHIAPAAFQNYGTCVRVNKSSYLGTRGMFAERDEPL
jgi:hypothetical protein